MRRKSSLFKCIKGDHELAETIKVTSSVSQASCMPDPEQF